MGATALASDHLRHGLPRWRAARSVEMSLFIRLGSWLHRGAALPAAAVHLPAVLDSDELPVEPERPWGCGWFDSSLDLRQGLAVIEHAGIALDLAIEQMLRPEATRH
jgi:hypothetical protein